jgi:iron complex outermembrane receptor protein
MICGSLRAAFVIRILIGACASAVLAEGAFAQTAPVELGTIEVQSNTESATGPVEGYIATRTATGAKTDTPIQEIPQSITVVTADRMRDQAVTTVQQAFRYVPGVVADPYGPDSRVDSPTVRAIEVDTYLDGMRTTNSWFNYQRVDPYTLERAEVLRGPASVLYGATSVGGIINLVSKRPQALDLHEVGVQYGSFNRKQIQTDHTGKITADGDWLYRVIGVFRDSDYQTDYVKDDRTLVMPSVTWRPTNMTAWTVMATYQKDKTGSSTAFLPVSGTILYNPNGRIPINRFVSEPGFDLYQTETKSITSLFEHRFSDAFRISHNMRYQDVDGTYRTSYPVSWLPNAPNAPDPYIDPAQRNVYRAIDVWLSRRKTFTSDSNAEVKFRTGPLSHTLLVGFDFRRMNETGEAGYDEDLRPFDLYAPVYTGFTLPPMYQAAPLVQKQAGVYVQDQVRWGALIGTYGLRYDKASSAIEGLPTQNDSAMTGRAGLMYELPFGLSPYVSYSQSFTPLSGSSVYGNDQCNDSTNGLCKPVRGEQYEVGFKYRQSKDLVINGAVFDITQKNRTATDPNAASGYIQIGKARIRGAELEVLATVMENLDLIGTYTYLDAKVVSGDNAGSRIEAVPEQQASLWAKYRFALFNMPGFSVGGGVRYIGAVWDGYDTLKTPGYTLFDAMLAWENENWRFQLNAVNLADKEYFSVCLSRGDCFYGSRRTILAQLTYKFGADKASAAAKP